MRSVWGWALLWSALAASVTAAEVPRDLPPVAPASFAQMSQLAQHDGPAPAQLPAAPYVDFDRYCSADPAMLFDSSSITEAWQWQVLPEGHVYPAYLASTKESRLSTHVMNRAHDGWLMDSTLGARVGLLRFGDSDPWLPQGWQVDAEGSAQLRLDIPEDVDVRSVDFRGGLPISYGIDRHRLKFGYYHLSSHLGDEFLLKNPSFSRLNFSRDVLLVGYAYYLTHQLRAYGEAGWAFHEDVSRQWEFQCGLDYAPVGPTGIVGAPFFALNAHLREEVNYGGGFTAQAGWAWRGTDSTSLLRTGLHYYNGESNQFSFYDEHEEQVGFGLWYDF